MKHVPLTCVLVLQLALGPLAAQGPPAQPPPSPGERLRLTVLEGEGAIHNIRRPLASDLIVQVTDRDRGPVAKAAVVFTLPAQGASGSFPGGANSTVMTDAQGRAMVRGLRPNKVAGKFEIRVSVTHQGETARATITQFNMAVGDAAPKSGGGKILAVLIIAGAAAAGGAVAATRKSGSSPTSTQAPPTITVSPGTGAVGPPQ